MFENIKSYIKSLIYRKKQKLYITFDFGEADQFGLRCMTILINDDPIAKGTYDYNGNWKMNVSHGERYVTSGKSLEELKNRIDEFYYNYETIHILKFP